MRKFVTRWAAAMSLALVGACMGPSLGTPTQVAQDVLLAVDEGRTADAAKIVAAAEDRSDLRDLVFPRLYSAARTRYEDGDFEGAAGILRAVAGAYDKTVAVRVALAYSLFLARADSIEPSAEEVAELGEVLDQLDAKATNPPAWVGLARTQNSIDRGDLETAREAMAQFHERWDGDPESLAPYVDDLDRYLSSH